MSRIGLINSSSRPLGRLKSLIVIPDWISFAEVEQTSNHEWIYRNQVVQSIKNASVIFIPLDFSRLFFNDFSYILLYGAGVYWTKFSVSRPAITTDIRYITGLLIPEKRWLDYHFNTEPFVFPPPYDRGMIIGDFIHEFSFNALRSQDDEAGHARRAFGRGVILAQLVFPFKEPLLLLRKASESYEEFDSPNSPMRILISEFGNNNIINEIAIEKPNIDYEETIPGIRDIQSNLLQIFPAKWSNKIYLDGLRREVAKVSKDFAFIGAPMILK